MLVFELEELPLDGSLLELSPIFVLLLVPLFDIVVEEEFDFDVEVLDLTSSLDSELLLATFFSVSAIYFPTPFFLHLTY